MIFNSQKEIIVSVYGLGYVGLPLAVSLSKHYKVMGYDNDPTKIESYSLGIDLTEEVGNENLLESNITYTSDTKILNQANFHIVAVPTPINKLFEPDLTNLIVVCEEIGKILKKGDIVVFESTVYPGATRDICIPILEKISNLTCPNDFGIGYSPERINPGDKVNTLENIKKIVSGIDGKSLEIVSQVYGKIIKPGVHTAETLEIAEGAKILENIQRDVNISFMNEMAMLFDHLGIDFSNVLNAAKTKWNFLDFSPGLVGGHCIGVDPYYLIDKAKTEGFIPNLIIESRKVNENVVDFIVNKIISLSLKKNKKIRGSRIGIFGLTFKEDTPDTRNSKSIELVNKLTDLGALVSVSDPYISSNSGYNYISNEKDNELDVIVVTVPHKEFLMLHKEDWNKFYSDKTEGIFIDIKGNFSELLDQELHYWRL